MEKKKIPINKNKNILITSALPYVNNVPHLGNIIGSVLSADVFSRYCKLRGLNCIYICGTDEYGTATETKAIQEKTTPKEICDKYHKIHKEIYEWFNIKFDLFGRTTTEQQIKIAQNIFLKLYENNYLLKDQVQQLFCEKCDKFLADRYVEGTCPLCQFNDARGDQCDGCGQLLNAIDLINPHCKLDGTCPIIRSTEHLFLDLPKLSPILNEWVQHSSQIGKWCPHAIQITNAWIHEGLKPRCITRDLKWGVPVPLEEFKDKVLYVWFDAPIGYISITANYTNEWEKWWKNPDQVQLYQFMGKDNIPFHTIIFPSCLLGTKEKWTLLYHISTTEYLNYEGGKFSKSRGIGIFGNDAKESGIPSEVWRYYLLINRPENSDSSFSWDDFADKNNGELLANLGNFVNRAITFVNKFFEGKLPSYNFQKEDNELINLINKEIQNYIQNLENVHLKDGLKIAMGISKLGNKYFTELQPWFLINSDKERCGTVLYLAINLVKLLATLLDPYIPTISEKICHQLNIKYEELSIQDSFMFDIPVGHSIGNPEILFKKIETKDIEKWRKQFNSQQEKETNTDDFPLDIKGGCILSVEDHPNDSNLFVIKVNLGNQERQVVARLKLDYKKEELLGKNILLLCNLPIAEFKGIKSEGMILVAQGKGKNKESFLRILQPYQLSDNISWPGINIIAEGTNQKIQSPITLKEFQKLDLKINSQGKAIYKKFLLKAKTEIPIEISANGISGPAKIK